MSRYRHLYTIWEEPEPVEERVWKDYEDRWKRLRHSLNVGLDLMMEKYDISLERHCALLYIIQVLMKRFMELSSNFSDNKTHTFEQIQDEYEEAIDLHDEIIIEYEKAQNYRPGMKLKRFEYSGHQD
ncbi:unnamed protein product [Caenorhabditis bovis]|uniref:Uncharacterized protein n=1 Tax=Caenorhabditis bovis TaxID=2654633 RepID=A0A8S1FGE3_9PELO|nr:unnamed protein product [Caenorhabditis bovis]